MEAVCEAVPSLGLSGMATDARGDPRAPRRGAARRPWPPCRRSSTAWRWSAAEVWGGGAKVRQWRWWWVVATESGVGEATEKHGERTEPERVGSVPQISGKKRNPHLERIFFCGVNPTLVFHPNTAKDGSAPSGLAQTIEPNRR